MCPQLGPPVCRPWARRRGCCTSPRARRLLCTGAGGSSRRGVAPAGGRGGGTGDACCPGCSARAESYCCPCRDLKSPNLLVDAAWRAKVRAAWRDALDTCWALHHLGGMTAHAGPPSLPCFTCFCWSLAMQLLSLLLKCMSSLSRAGLRPKLGEGSRRAQQPAELGGGPEPALAGEPALLPRRRRCPVASYRRGGTGWKAAPPTTPPRCAAAGA